MKKYICSMLSVFIATLQFHFSANIPPLSVISLQLQAEDWVTTKTARVVIRH